MPTETKETIRAWQLDGAKILAAGGLTSSVLAMVGGFVGWSWMIGAGASVMLAANLLTLISKDKSHV